MGWFLFVFQCFTSIKDDLYVGQNQDLRQRRSRPKWLISGVFECWLLLSVTLLKSGCRQRSSSWMHEKYFGTEGAWYEKIRRNKRERWTCYRTDSWNQSVGRTGPRFHGATPFFFLLLFLFSGCLQLETKWISFTLLGDKKEISQKIPCLQFLPAEGKSQGSAAVFAAIWASICSFSFCLMNCS